MKHSRRKGFKEIVARLSYGKRGLFKASKHEVSHGRDITWTLRGMAAPDWVVANWPGSATVVEVRSQGRRDGKKGRADSRCVTGALAGAVRIR